MKGAALNFRRDELYALGNRHTNAWNLEQLRKRGHIVAVRRGDSRGRPVTWRITRKALRELEGEL